MYRQNKYFIECSYKNFLLDCVPFNIQGLKASLTLFANEMNISYSHGPLILDIQMYLHLMTNKFLIIIN